MEKGYYYAQKFFFQSFLLLILLPIAFIWLPSSISCIVVYSSLLVLCRSCQKKHRVILPVRNPEARILCCCLAITVAAYPIASVLNAIGIRITGENGGIALHDCPVWLLFALYGLFVPMVEEICFRGVYMELFARNSANYAVLFSALSFALIHLRISSIMYAFFFGMIFAVVRLVTDNLVYSFCMHVFFNVGNLAIMVLLPDIEINMLPWYIWVGFFGIGLCAFWVLIRKLLDITKFAFPAYEKSGSFKGYITKESLFVFSVCLLIVVLLQQNV